MDPGELEDGGDAVEEAADDKPVQRGGVLHLQYSTVQYCTLQYITLQYITVQYWTGHFTLGRSDRESIEMADRVSTAVTPDQEIDNITNM